MSTTTKGRRSATSPSLRRSRWQAAGELLLNFAWTELSKHPTGPRGLLADNLYEWNHLLAESSMSEHVLLLLRAGARSDAQRFATALTAVSADPASQLVLASWMQHADWQDAPSLCMARSCRAWARTKAYPDILASAKLATEMLISIALVLRLYRELDDLTLIDFLESSARHAAAASLVLRDYLLTSTTH